MKVGDLVKEKGSWVEHNPWMKDTGLDDSGEDYGVIVEVRNPRWDAIPTVRVYLTDGRIETYEVRELEVISAK